MVRGTGELRQLRTGLTFLTLAVLVVGTLVLVLCLISQSNRVSMVPQPFDQQVWREQRPVGMALELEEKPVLISMTPQEVEALLGPPDAGQVASGQGMTQYDLEHLWYMDVVFEGGRAVSVFVGEPL